MVTLNIFAGAYLSARPNSESLYVMIRNYFQSMR